MPRAGMVGALPPPAWGAVMGMLSSLEGDPERAWRATVLELRRTCKALAEMVAAACVGGAGWLDVATAEEAAQLEAAATAGLGRALVVFVCVHEDLNLARALALAVERDHMIGFDAPHPCTPDLTQAFEAALIEASREGQLVSAYLVEGESSGWSVDVMAQLSVVRLVSPEREAIASLVSAGILQRILLSFTQWTDMSILSSLREVNLNNCTVEDMSSLADVPRLIVHNCRGFNALPAMRNDALKVGMCDWLIDVSGLAGGRVGRLELRDLLGVKVVSAIGAMRPPPRTVILEEMDVQDVSMLVGVRRLEVIKCYKLDMATLAALEGKVGTIRCTWK